jgi:hypothetical protein
LVVGVIVWVSPRRFGGEGALSECLIVLGNVD